MPSGTPVNRSPARFGEDTFGEDMPTAGTPADTHDHDVMGMTSWKEVRNTSDAIALKNAGLNDNDADDRGYSDNDADDAA